MSVELLIDKYSDRSTSTYLNSEDYFAKKINLEIFNITTHSSEYVYRELGNELYERTRYRRRPGTVAVAAATHNKYDITVVPHILCNGFSREDTEYILLDLQFLGITNLLVLMWTCRKSWLWKL